MIKIHLQISFQVLLLTNTVYKTNTENVEFIAHLWSFNSFYLLLRGSKEKIRENFTRRKISIIKLQLDENPLWKVTLKKKINFSTVFMTFEHYSQVLTLRILYINSLEEGFAHLPEILSSSYGMKLKLGPVIALDKRRR